MLSYNLQKGTSRLRGDSQLGCANRISSMVSRMSSKDPEFEDFHEKC